MHTTAVSDICTTHTTPAVSCLDLDMAGTSACAVLSVTLFVTVAEAANASGDAATCQ